jgi:hypothetical protein
VVPRLLAPIAAAIFSLKSSDFTHVLRIRWKTGDPSDRG